MSKSEFTFAPMKGESTIVALSTPQGIGAIGVIRLSGAEALTIASKLLDKSIHEVAGNTVHFCRFRVEQKVLDEVVATVFRAPKSYTGEDVVELSFHGSQYILNQAIEALLQAGAELAQPGEFTQRAFLNRKMDLSQAEAVADLIASESAAEHRLAMHQMRGGFSDEIKKLREDLIHFASLIELELDFSEEDVEFANREQLIDLIDNITTMIRGLIQSFRYGNVVKHGVPVAIIGKPNAGKSTLLNALLNEERAIVTEIAGTTRDAIEDTINIAGIRFRFIDTAGIRETEDHVEAIGVKKSLEKMQSASIVLYLFDASEPLTEHQQLVNTLQKDLKSALNIIAIANKTDMLEGELKDSTINDREVVSISAKTGRGLEELQNVLIKEVESLKEGGTESIVTNARHVQALKATDEALTRGKEAIESGLSGDLVAADIREALHHLGSITGDISTDDLLGNIFGKFCIGK